MPCGVTATAGSNPALSASLNRLAVTVCLEQCYGESISLAHTTVPISPIVSMSAHLNHKPPGTLKFLNHS
jgi:hypothetical protein